MARYTTFRSSSGVCEVCGMHTSFISHKNIDEHISHKNIDEHLPASGRHLVYKTGC